MKKKVTFSNNIEINYIPLEDYGEVKKEKIDNRIYYYGITITILFLFIFLFILLK